MGRLTLLYNMKNRKIKFKGFTLIELMVATSIFVVIMLASMGSLFVLLDAAKNSKALRFSMDNVNFAMESMTRSIRMGKTYVCLREGEQIGLEELPGSGQDCREGGTLLAFFPQGVTDHIIIYKIEDRQDHSTRTLKKCTPESGCVEIVSSNVDVKRLKFFTNGAEEDSGIQPSVYIIMEGTVMVKEEAVSFSIQTLASMRNL